MRIRTRWVSVRLHPATGSLPHKWGPCSAGRGRNTWRGFVTQYGADSRRLLCRQVRCTTLECRTLFTDVQARRSGTASSDAENGLRPIAAGALEPIPIFPAHPFPPRRDPLLEPRSRRPTDLLGYSGRAPVEGTPEQFRAGRSGVCLSPRDRISYPAPGFLVDFLARSMLARINPILLHPCLPIRTDE